MGLRTEHVGTVPLSTLADGNIRTAYPLRGKGLCKIVDFFAMVSVVTTDTAAAATLNLEIDGTNVTGGVITLGDADTAPSPDTLGGKFAGTAITAANTFVDSASLDVEAASVTAYTDGQIDLYIVISDN